MRNKMSQNLYLNRINTFAEFQNKMKAFEEHIEMMVGEKDKPCPLHLIIVPGERGVGKTLTVRKMEKKFSDIRDFAFVKGRCTAISLYKTMYENPNAIIVLDDSDDLFKDKGPASSLLKSACDSYTDRVINWMTNSADIVNVTRYHLKNNDEIDRKLAELAAMKENKRLRAKWESGNLYPNEFHFFGGIIILSNKTLETIDRVTDGALSNRGWHMEICMSIDGVIDLFKNSVDSVKTFNETIPLKRECVQKAVEFMSRPDVKVFLEENQLLPTFRNLEKISFEIQNGVEPSFDMLVSNTEHGANYY